MHDAGLGGELRELDGGLRHGEIDDAVGIAEQRLGIVGDRDVLAADAGELGRIAPDQRRAGIFQRAGQR